MCQITRKRKVGIEEDFLRSLPEGTGVGRRRLTTEDISFKRSDNNIEDER